MRAFCNRRTPVQSLIRVAGDDDWGCMTTIQGSLPRLRIVVLAAGYSRRLGMPKALARVRGRTLLRRTLDVVATQAKPIDICVVIPPAAARYRAECRGRARSIVVNPHRGLGLSSSVRLGLARVRCCAGALMLPVDLVELTPADLGRLIACWRRTRRRVVARGIVDATHEPGVSAAPGASRVRCAAGAPLILPHWLYAHARELSGDQGLGQWVRRLPSDIVSLVAMPSATVDVDTREHLDRARRRRGGHAGPYGARSR